MYNNIYNNMYNNNDNCQLIYSSAMQIDTMQTENYQNIDFSLNNYENEQNNPNDTIYDIFSYELEKGIEFGDINIIKNAIKDYGHLIDKSYTEWANSIIFEIVQEQMEDIQIK
jgi:hypothetical protein